MILDEDEIKAAYDAAEMSLHAFVAQDVVLVRDERKHTDIVRLVARGIADTVIHSILDRQLSTDGDISDLDIDIEWANGHSDG